MIDFQELLELCQAEALSDKFSPTELSVWESICRAYSKKFHTPLHIVQKMDPEYVVRQNYADELGEVKLDDSLEALLDTIRKLEDPTYEADEEKELQDFMVQAEKEEADRIAQGLPLKSLFKKRLRPVAKKAEEKPPEPPKSGGFDTSNIDEENER